MTDYVKVQNNEIVYGPAPLPKAYNFADGRSTGNFDLMDASIIIEEGFLPVVWNVPSYNGGYQALVSQAPVLGDVNVTYTYAVQDRPLAEMKANKITEVSDKKNDLLYSGITYNGHVFRSDRDSLQSIAISAFSASQIGSGWSSIWQLQDGSFITLSQADVLGLNSAVNTRVVDLRSQAQTAILAIEALTTSLDVYNYNIAMS